MSTRVDKALKLIEFFADGLNRQRGGKYFNFYALCLPWIVMNFVGLVIDVSAAINYFGDYMSVLWDITVLLEMLAVQNVEEVRPILTDRHQTVIYPTAMAIQNMYLAASKMFLPLLYCFMFGLLSIKSMWQVVSENKRIQVHLARSWAVMKSETLHLHLKQNIFYFIKPFYAKFVY